ncbi:MAG: hypothetical protein QM610_07885 [Chitinophagaceae bacterium]
MKTKNFKKLLMILAIGFMGNVKGAQITSGDQLLTKKENCNKNSETLFKHMQHMHNRNYKQITTLLIRA